MKNFNIQKTIVTAKTRKLSSKWTFEEFPETLPPLSMTELVKTWYMSNRGHCIPIYEETTLQEAIEWCKKNISDFISSNHQRPMSDEQFQEEIEQRAKSNNWAGSPRKVNHYYPNVEDEIMSLLTQEIDNDILGQIGVKRRKLPVRYFFFGTSQDALLFKLTWGGE